MTKNLIKSQTVITVKDITDKTNKEEQKKENRFIGAVVYLVLTTSFLLGRFIANIIFN
ncbi:hypothetical protein N7577_07490 [Enterobacter roggenkampii]|uniref:hypothetical protein n=1 Tax=Enterobacter roggenkampii TaxID=1812935 RepID=UPI0024480805|nr:hypothetical protein [Enterobacter roggenkampii]MDG9878081.1 hypothetical protein [Enterobacter roggenkampii]